MEHSQPVQHPKIKLNSVIDREMIVSNQEFSNHSESIAKHILEKVISLTITEAQRREIFQKTPNHCYAFLMSIINNYIKMEFVAHERDDMHFTTSNARSSMFGSNELKDLSKDDRTYSNKDLKDNTPIIFPPSNILNLNLIERNASNDMINHNAYNYISVDSKDAMGKSNDESQSVKSNTKSNNNLNFNNEIEKNNINHSNMKGQFIFYDNKFFGINDWNFIDEPVSILYFYL